MKNNKGFTHLNFPQKNLGGFTLIELLVVVSIIGLLASVVLVGIDNTREGARVAKAKTELRQLNIAIESLYADTGLHPNHLQISPCIQDPEVYLDSCKAGLQCTDGGFPGWVGSYVSEVPKDPWGTYYFFDPDYRCRTFVEGCQGMPDNTWVRAIVSFGPNKSENYDDGDNVVRILCR